MKDFSVFVLDDDIMFCSLLDVLVKHEIFTSKLRGYKVTFSICHDVAKIDAAVDHIRSEKPDLVMLDYMLGMEADSCLTSIDLLERIIPYCSDILIISGVHLKDTRLQLAKEVLKNTRIEFLSKPFGVEKLVGVIKKSIKR